MRTYINLFKYPIVNVQKRGMSYRIRSSEYRFLTWYPIFKTTLLECALIFSSGTFIRMPNGQNTICCTACASECVCIFVHFYYRGYSRMLKMYSYLYLLLVHNDKVTNTQMWCFFLIKICLYMYAYVCQSFDTDHFWSNSWSTKTTVFFNVSMEQS